MIHNIRLYLDYMLIEGQRGFMISTFEPETKEKMIQGIALCTISDDEKANEEIVIDGLLSAPRNLILGTDKKEIGLEYRCRGAGTQLMHHIYKLGQQLGRQHLYLNSTITGQGFYYGLGMKRIYCLGHITFYMPIDRGIPPSFTAKTYLPVLNLSQ